MVCLLSANGHLKAGNLPFNPAPARDTMPDDKHSSFEAALNYQSDNVYYGRKDTVALPYLIPMLTYYHRSGIYFSASAAYLNTSTEHRFDLVMLEGGYDLTIGKYDGEFSVTKYFYNSQSTNVASAIEASVAYQNDYDFGFIKPSFTATLNMGSHTDIEGALGLQHTFELFHDKLAITPAFTANGGTLNFYDNYYRTKHFKKRNGQKVNTGIATVTGTVANASSFKIMDYEPGLSVKYYAGKFTFSFSPTYAIPVHPAVLNIHTVYSTGTVTNRTRVETLENSFFWTLGATYKF